MKKWHLEGVCSRIASKKLALPNSAQTELYRRGSFSQFNKEPQLVLFCRKIAAFFIRFF